MNENNRLYNELLELVQIKIRHAQQKAVFSVNRELLILYWETGKLIAQRQQQEGWGSAIIPRLSRDINNLLPEIKGYSIRNIGRMILCQDKNELVAEYALKGIDKPIGISEYQLMKQLPIEFQSSLPSIEQIEAELGGCDE